MKANSRLRLGVLLLPLFALFLILSTSQYSFSAQPKEAMQAPDVLVMISLRGDGMSSIAYAKVINKKEAENDLSRLVKETGWQIQNINITNDGDPHPTTAIDFIRSSSANDAELPIEPIITAYKKLARIQIVYIVPPSWNVKLVPTFENNQVSVKMRGGTGSYQYDVLVKDHNFDKLVLPRYAPSVSSGAKPGSASDRQKHILVVITLAVGTALFVYFLMKGIAGKREPQSKRRS